MTFQDDGWDASRRARHFSNDTYKVLKYENGRGATWLAIQRRDGQPSRSWPDLQAIKNSLLGPEREAVELFPADSRLVDAANMTHLWALPVGEIYPVGFRHRFVVPQHADALTGGWK